MNFDPAQLKEQIAETEEDLRVFLRARELVRERVQYITDHPRTGLLPPITDWSGTDAVLGSLDLSCHALEHTVEELKQLLRSTEAGHAFRVVEGGHEQDGR